MGAGGSARGGATHPGARFARTGSGDQAALFEAFGNLLKVAVEDQDDWVALTARTTRNITEAGFSGGGEQHPAFTGVREEIKGLLGRCGLPAPRPCRFGSPCRPSTPARRAGWGAQG